MDIWPDCLDLEERRGEKCWGYVVCVTLHICEVCMHSTAHSRRIDPLFPKPKPAFSTWTLCKRWCNSWLLSSCLHLSIPFIYTQNDRLMSLCVQSLSREAFLAGCAIVVSIISVHHFTKRHLSVPLYQQQKGWMCLLSFTRAGAIGAFSMCI